MQRLLGLLEGKNWPIADWHVPRNDPRTYFGSSPPLVSNVANRGGKISIRFGVVASMFLPPHGKTEWFGVEVKKEKEKRKEKKLPLSLLLSSFSSLTADLLKRYSFFISIYYHFFYLALYRRRLTARTCHTFR